MHWNPKKNRWELPPGRRTGPVTKLFWALQDQWRSLQKRWRSLDPVDKNVIKFLVLGGVLWIIATRPW